MQTRAHFRAITRRVLGIAVVLVAGAMPSLPASAQTIPLPTDHARRHNAAVSRRGSGLDVELTFSPQDVSLVVQDGFTMVGLADSSTPLQTPGYPSLPARAVNVAVPAGIQVQGVQVEADEVLLAKDVLVYPSQPVISVSTPLANLPAFVPPATEAYAVSTKVPASLAELAGQHTMRGHAFVSLRVNPVRYVPASRELYLATRIKIHLLGAPLAKRAAIACRDRHSLFSKALGNIVVNADMIEDSPAPTTLEAATPLTSEPVALGLPAGDVDYLVITSDALVSAFQPLAEHRYGWNSLSTAVASVETITASYTGVDTQAKIRACIIDYKTNHGTTFVVFGGDDTVVPVRLCRVTCNDTWDVPCDMYYAGLDSTWDENGNGHYGEASSQEGDLAADVFVGRIPIRTAAQATNYINKVIQFEQNPISPDKLLLMGVQIGSLYANTDYRFPTDILNDGYPEFATHTPVSDAEMWTRRMYRDCIQPYYQPTALTYFFDTLSAWDTTTAGSYDLIKWNFDPKLALGWYQVFFMTHGDPVNWQMEGGGAYQSYVAAANTGRLGFIYTGSCRTAWFDGGVDPCLGEAFLRNTAGPVAYFGCSRDNWYYPDSWTGGTAMDYAREFYKAFYNHTPTSLAEVYYAHKAARAIYSTYDGPDRWVQFAMDYLGDPALLTAKNVPVYTFTTNVQGQGTVALNPPGGTYSYGTTVTATATPAATWKFHAWDGSLTGPTNPATILSRSDMNITAIFWMLGDINGDMYVNVGDLQLLVAAWGSDNSGAWGNWNPDADLDADGHISVSDLQLLVASWGRR